MEVALVVTSLRHALEEAIAAPGARRLVTVKSVHLAQAGALYSFCIFQRWRGLWGVQNLGRLCSLMGIDCLLSTMAALIDDPEVISLPRIALLGRYALHLRTTASDVGEVFVQAAAPTLESVIDLADSAAHNPALVMEVEFVERTRNIGRRLVDLRSRKVPIADHPIAVVPVAAAADPDSDSSSSDDDDDDVGDLPILSLGDALYNAVHDPDTERRVTVCAVKVSDSAALSAVAYTASNWSVVRNINRVTNLAVVDICFQVIERGFLRMVRHRPNSHGALALIGDYAGRIRRTIGTVGGQFAVQGAIICDALVAYADAAAYLNAHQMRASTNLIRARVIGFRASLLTINTTRDSSSSSSSSSSSE